MTLHDIEWRTRIKDALADVYEGVGHDVWGDDHVPDDDEFVDVLSDLVRNWVEHHYSSNRFDCTSADLDLFFALSETERRVLILEVGP